MQKPDRARTGCDPLTQARELQLRGVDCMDIRREG